MIAWYSNNASYWHRSDINLEVGTKETRIKYYEG